MILCSGCFDGLHAGHVGYLQAALGECYPDKELVVAVAPDTYIRRYKHRTPIYSVAARMFAVGGIKGVAFTLEHGPDGVAEVIRQQRPKFFVKGKDWRGKLPDDIVNACREVGASMVFVDSAITVHTSDAVSTHQ